MTTLATMAYCNNLDGDDERRQQHTTISHNEERAGTNAQRNEVEASGGVRHGVLVCQGGEEGGGRHAGEGCSCRKGMTEGSTVG